MANRAGKKTAKSSPVETQVSTVGPEPLLVVGIGASAGGLAAVTQLLGALPADTGMAFVLLQHLSPTHPSLLAEILARATAMPVAEVHDQPSLRPDHVYVIPPNRDMVISRGALRLLPRAKRRGANGSIDLFFRSLAEHQGHRGIGVILSGTASDGALGLQQIKAEGGITFAQDDTALYSSMPHSAVDTGCVDFVLPPEAIAGELARIARHLSSAPAVRKDAFPDPSRLPEVLQLLRDSTGVDFTLYKTSTIFRRINRRMVLHKAEGLREYLQLLTSSPGELGSLHQDLLINVTSFFRNPEVFDALKLHVFPKLFQDRSRHEPIRVWVPGCSTGEEAYSIAIALKELAEARDIPLPVQVFATDLNGGVIEKARAAVYPESIAHDVSPERLRRFFMAVDGQYHVSKQIRDLCVFARHNVLADPPFSRIDLLSCRNLLIYLEPVAQRRIVPLLHYALKPGGCLVLGSSETVSSYGDLFEAEDAAHKIFRKTPGSRRSLPGPAARPPAARGAPLRPADRPREAADETGFEVIPIEGTSARPGGFLVLFGEATPAPPLAPLPRRKKGAAGPPGWEQSAERQNASLIQELAATREYLQSLIEQQEAANEELQSANEEFQSINEELETSKEEIQSSNEELVTVNDELQNRNRELNESTNDLSNLFASAQSAIIMLGKDLRIRRFTPMAEQVFHLVAADLGRPIRDLRLTIDLPALSSLLAEVIESGSVREREVQDEKGCWYQLSLRPYRTLDNHIDGAVMVLVDVDRIKRSQELLQSIVTTVHEPLLVLDDELRVQAANPAFYETFKEAPEGTLGRPLYALGNGLWNIPALRTLLVEVLPRNDFFEGFEVEHDFAAIGRKTMLLNARRLVQAEGAPRLILLAIEDITERKRLEEALRQRIVELAAADRDKDEFLALLAHELRNPLAPLRNAVQVLELPDVDSAAIGQARDIMKRQIQNMARLIEDLLDVSRITLRTVRLQREPVELATLVRQAVEVIALHLEARRQDLSLTLPDEAVYLDADPARMEQILGNLLNNASKFAHRGGHLALLAELAGGEIVIRVRDDGVGIAPEMLPRIFDLFTQEQCSLDRSQGGLGIGLTLVRSLVELHGGTVEAYSAGLEQGSELVVRLPVMPHDMVPAAETAEPGDAAAPAPATFPPRRILVVDDNVDTAESMAFLLRLKGHEIRVAHSGLTAIDAALSFAPEIVLLDIGLPGLDGYQVARKLRRHPSLAGAILVALTGYGQEEDRRLAREAGFDHHLTKPVDPQVIYRLTESL